MNVSDYLLSEIENRQLEICELTQLYRDKKIPYGFLAKRIKEIVSYIKEDIKEDLHN